MIGWMVAALWAVSGDPAEVRAQSAVPTGRDEIRLSFAPVVKAAAPAVVNIYTRRVERERVRSPLFGDPFFRRFFGEEFGPGQLRERVRTSLGSGVIVDESGTILTNDHVVKGADEIRVVLADRREFEAQLVLSDERTDLAVLQIDSGGEMLPFLEFRDSDSLEVGDLVLAIGNPFGVGQTVTSGIVSALARTGVGVSDFRFFIQTDAAINPGNSGGALVTMDGRLVGINSAIYSKSGGSIGIGFAVPSNMAQSVVAGIGGGRVLRPWLGVTGQPVTADIAQTLQQDRPRGVLINQVVKGSPAARAGLEAGDVVLSVDGRAVDDPEGLRFRFAVLGIGGTARLEVMRGGKTRQMAVSLEPAPEDPPRNETRIAGSNPLLGTVVANLSPALNEELGLPPTREGVIILGVEQGSFTARAGIEPGDIVRNVNGVDIARVKDLARVLDRFDGAARWRIILERNGRTVTLAIGE